MENDVEQSAGDSQILHQVKDELQVAGRLLMKSVQDKVDIGAELQPLFKADDRLREVFALEEHSDSG